MKTTGKLVLLDFDKTKMFRDFAIEYEVTDGFEKKMKEKFSYDSGNFHSESMNIKEVIGLHTKDVDHINEVREFVEEEYKKNKPVGSDGYISGWRHVHLFLNRYEYYIVEKLNAKTLYFKVINTGLHANYFKSYWSAFASLRYIWNRASKPTSKKLSKNSKQPGVSLKTEYYSHEWSLDNVGLRSIEFRMNDVIDHRIIPLYQAVLLATTQWIKLKKLKDKFKNYLMEGNSCRYDSQRHGSEIKYNDSKMYNYRLRKADKETMIINMEILHNVLVDNWLLESANILHNYFLDRVLRHF